MAFFSESKRPPVPILTVEQADLLLRTADAEIIPYLAIGLFAGPRRSEIQRLDWQDIDFTAGLIDFSSEKTKTKVSRWLKSPPTCGPGWSRWPKLPELSGRPVEGHNYSRRPRPISSPGPTTACDTLLFLTTWRCSKIWPRLPWRPAMPIQPSRYGGTSAVYGKKRPSSTGRYFPRTARFPKLAPTEWVIRKPKSHLQILP